MTLAIDGGSPVRTAPLVQGKGAELLGAEERDAVLRVLDSRSLFRYYGPDLLGEAAAFEAELAGYHGPDQRAVAVSSGTAALRTALAALGVGPGDEVVVPACTFIATVNAVVLAGAVPVIAEVDDTLGLDPAGVAAVLTPRTAAVIAVHLDNGQTDMDALLAVTDPAGVPVLEDVAQSMGASLHGRKLGTIGAMGAYSMQLDKNISTGEGGAVLTSDQSLALRSAAFQDQGGHFLTQHGAGRDHAPEGFVGDNLRITEIGAAIARVQLRRLDAILDAMRTFKARILADVGMVEGLTPRRLPDPLGDGGSGISYLLPDADLARRFCAALLAEGIPAGQAYGGLPVYATPSILGKRTASMKGCPWHCPAHPTEVSYRLGMCPQSEDLMARAARVGVSPAFSERDCDDVAEAISKVAKALLG
jgi:8-amino-3,8-dideoxy-alpha-D-manno-octulosonate transaminase